MTRMDEAEAILYEERPLGQALDFLRVLWAINHGLATTSRYMKSKFGVTGRYGLVGLIDKRRCFVRDRRSDLRCPLLWQFRLLVAPRRLRR